jgi:hypothetical protein
MPGKKKATQIANELETLFGGLGLKKERRLKFAALIKNLKKLDDKSDAEPKEKTDK